MLKVTDLATTRQLAHWVDQGYLNATRRGSGNEWQWAPGEARIAQRMARLVAVGFVPAAAAEHARLGEGRHDLGHGITVEVSGG